MSDKKGNEGGFFKFLYNSDTGEVLGRTGISWAKILIFYVIFYLGLAAFFGLMLYVFYCTLNMDTPKYLGSDSLIGTNPGVGFRPQPDQDSNVDSTLIWFNKNKDSDYKFWSNQLKTFVDEAAGINNGSSVTSELADDCTFENSKKAGTKFACKVDLANLGPCNEKSNFGYSLGEPCVLIKLNRIYGWTPERYGAKSYSQSEYLKELEKQTMPATLKDYIKKKISGTSDVAVQTRIADSVWISCQGENAADRENIGSMNYYPMPGIPSFYFPFQKQKFYQSPFVMVHFSRVVPGVLINIECKAYAANIFPDRQTRTGSVHFELMVD